MFDATPRLEAAMEPPPEALDDAPREEDAPAEEDLCGSLHMPARKPKGCTYGRKANRDGHQVRGSRHSREGHRAH